MFAVLWTALVFVTGVWLMPYIPVPLFRNDCLQHYMDFFDEGILHTVFWLWYTLNNHLGQILLVLELFLLWHAILDYHYRAKVEAMAVAREGQTPVTVANKRHEGQSGYVDRLSTVASPRL